MQGEAEAPGFVGRPTEEGRPMHTRLSCPRAWSRTCILLVIALKHHTEPCRLVHAPAALLDRFSSFPCCPQHFDPCRMAKRAREDDFTASQVSLAAFSFRLPF